VTSTRVDCLYLQLGDYLLIAEKVLGMDTRVLRHVADLGLAESALHAPAASFAGVDQYPDFAMKASVLCVRLAKNHALPDGNKRTAFLSTVEFAERNGYRWVPPPGDTPGGEETVAVMKAVAAGTMDEYALFDWMKDRLEKQNA
jgi:death-on-curing protein